MSAAETAYLDSSAIVKLVRPEAESQALKDFLAERPIWTSCLLALVEVARAIQRVNPLLLGRTWELFDDVELLGLDDAVLRAAASMEPPVMRALDAIHLAAAQSYLPPDGELITYDQRMHEAARSLGFTVLAPGR